MLSDLFQFASGFRGLEPKRKFVGQPDMISHCVFYMYMGHCHLTHCHESGLRKLPLQTHCVIPESVEEEDFI